MAKELNNLEKALSAIAKGTKAAKDTAAEAKKLAESPTVTAELDDKGKLKLNGTVTEITVIQPSEIAKSVGKALGNSDTPSKLLEEQIKFESAQEQAALKIAVERGKFYVEDALPDKIREKVWSRYYESTNLKSWLKPSPLLCKLFRRFRLGMTSFRSLLISLRAAVSSRSRRIRAIDLNFMARTAEVLNATANSR